MDELTKLKGLSNEEGKKENKALKIAKCQLCDNNKYVYYCENGHKNLFCRDCLFKTIEEKGRIRYIARCLPFAAPYKDCNYKPLNQGGGFTSNPFAYEQ